MAQGEPTASAITAGTGIRIPGARYRKVKRTIVRPVTIDGETEYVRRTETFYKTLPPRDWRRGILRGLVVAAILVLIASLAWTTASVGALLLTLAVVAPIAFGAAAVFDVVWISCIAAEYLARFDDDRARLPRIAGWISLGISMAAVFVHGYQSGSTTTGMVGSVVSALAKGLTTVVIRLTTPRLDDDQQAWLIARRGKIGAQRALMLEQLDLNRDLATVRAQRAALGLPPERDSETGQPRQDETRPRQHDGIIRSAVRSARDTYPTATDRELAEKLTNLGVPVDEDTVRAVAGQRRDSEAGQGQRRSAPKLSVVPRDERDGDEDSDEDEDTIAATVRRCVRDNVTDLDRVLSAVRQVHGQDVSRPTVRKSLDRALGRTAS